MADLIKIGVIGASGYTGSDLIRLLIKHPNVKLEFATANNHAGQNLQEIFPYLTDKTNIALQKWEDVNWNNVDVIFSCLPHGMFHEIFMELPSNKIIIDLSADFRLDTTDDYSNWYNFKHVSADYLRKFTYGLTELNRSEIKKSKLVACPGCYPTATLLGLYPLLKDNLVDCMNITIDAKSGVTGAGRSPKRDLLFSEISESLRPYSATGHRHIPEIEQQISKIAQTESKINFVPHLVPMNRGELITSYLKTREEIGYEQILEVYTKTFKGEKFISILENGVLPNTINVRGSNNCHISIVPGRIEGTLMVISAIDNLVKGSSGQAIQNMNLILGYPEELGISHISLFP